MKYLFNPKFLSYVIIIALPIVGIILAYLQASYFDAYPYDGPFQHLYPLREIDHGYFPGIDFNFFHGIGIPYANYPIYRLMGGGIFGALFSAKITQFFSVYIGLLFVVGILFPQKTWPLAFFIIIGITVTQSLFIGLAPLWDVSSFGIRTVSGLFLAGILFYQTNNKVISIFLLAGISIIGVFLGTEQGFYCAAAVAMVITLTNYYCNSIKQRLIYSFAFLLIFFLGLLLITLIIFGSIDPLLFIRNIISDQVWYFGAPPVFFLKSLSEIYNNAHYDYILEILASSVLVGAAIIIAYKKKIINDQRYRAILFLMLWGLMSLTSNFSIVAYHYFEPLIRAMLIASLIIIFSYIENLIVKKQKTWE